MGAMRLLLSLVVLCAAAPAMAQEGRPTVHVDEDDDTEERDILSNATFKVRDCYEKLVKDRPDLHGRMTVKLEVAADGKVTKVTTSGFDDEKVIACTVGVLGSLGFYPRATTLTYTLVFKPKSMGFGTIGHGARGRTLKQTARPADGKLSQDDILRVMKGASRSVRACNKAVTEGKVVVKFTIGTDGKVTTATATGLTDEVRTCIVKVVRALKFPASTGVSTVSFPFVFSRAE